MKEALIRKKAIEILNKEDFLCWYPQKSRWAKESDIFGCYDILAVNKTNGNILFIQLTTLSNIRTREKKVRRKALPVYSEIWGYDKVNKNFKIISIYGKTI